MRGDMYNNDKCNLAYNKMQGAAQTSFSKSVSAVIKALNGYGSEMETDLMCVQGNSWCQLLPFANIQ